MSFIKRIILIPFMLLGVQGCSLKPTPVESNKLDQYGCNRPPADVFTKAGIDVNLAPSTFGKVALGEIKFVSSPEVVTLASQIATDERLQDYERCLLKKRDGYTASQVAHKVYFNAFMKTNPTADQVADWMKDNPYPADK